MYHRILVEFGEDDFISSEKISELTGFSSAQVRRDLAYFGQFGVTGKGYASKHLRECLAQILGIDKRWKIALVGVGNLGTALLKYRGFANRGFRIVAAFDTDSKKNKQVINKIKIYPIGKLREIMNHKKIKIAILAVPARYAQEVADQLIDSGIKAILNFAPVRLRVLPNVSLYNIDMSIELERLSYLISRSGTK